MRVRQTVARQRHRPLRCIGGPSSTARSSTVNERNWRPSRLCGKQQNLTEKSRSHCETRWWHRSSANVTADKHPTPKPPGLCEGLRVGGSPARNLAKRMRGRRGRLTSTYTALRGLPVELHAQITSKRVALPLQPAAHAAHTFSFGTPLFLGLRELNLSCLSAPCASLNAQLQRQCLLVKDSVRCRL